MIDTGGLRTAITAEKTYRPQTCESIAGCRQSSCLGFSARASGNIDALVISHCMRITAEVFLP
jgi:hypothetical protein